MKAEANKTPDNKTHVTANEATQTKAGGEGLAQFTDNRPETTQLQQLQAMANSSFQVGHIAQLQAMANGQKSQEVVQSKKNNTGLPDKLKSGIENLSGMSMDDVKVHRNSDKPAQLNAHAYAQGTDIHLASGQEKHLPHEAWHVVQQKQGRVKPTRQLKGKVNVNDDEGLEKEADAMGAKALQLKHKYSYTNSITNSPLNSSDTIQLHKYEQGDSYWHLYAADHRPAHVDRLDSKKGKSHKNSPKLFLEGPKAGQCYDKGGKGKLLFTVSAADLTAHRLQWLIFYCSPAEVLAGAPAVDPANIVPGGPTHAWQ